MLCLSLNGFLFVRFLNFLSKSNRNGYFDYVFVPGLFIIDYMVIGMRIGRLKCNLDLWMKSR